MGIGLFDATDSCITFRALRLLPLV
jgi:hypothetical protein